MTDRWARAEEAFRQREAGRRYRRDDAAWERDEDDRGEFDDSWGDHDGFDEPGYGESGVHGAPGGYGDRGGYEDDYDTAVIPRYADDDPAYAEVARSRGKHAPRVDQPAYDEPDVAYDEPDRDGLDDEVLDDDEVGTETARASRSRPAPRSRPAGRTRGAERGAPAARPRKAAGAARSDRAARSPQAARRRPSSKRSAGDDGRRKHTRWMLIALAVLLLGGVGTYGVMKLTGGYTPPADFAGPAGPVVVVRVESGDTATQISQEMYDKGVVASSEAFYEAAVQNEGMNAIHPGYYQIPSQSPAVDAVTALLSPEARVGNMVISEGRQLHDQTDVNTGARKEGIYTKIAAASCVGEGAAAKCVTYEELDAAGASDDLAALGVPSWAEAEVRSAPDQRRQLEGLIAAGTWDFDPSGDARAILRELITSSAASYESTGLLESGANTGLSPYETLIAASLVEREALPQDMGKVARVIVNRLEIGQALQFDSTVNYSLDTTEVATTDADRARVTPWNTYAMSGLPANPISAPSLNALRAMESPEQGNWLYFVTIDMKGTTLFTDSYSQHLSNIDQALDSGILDSGR
ncbi:endolytic transglycosylase MltG [Nocardia shimofusensis]|uniref:endolytic transglycosylase MltG n=1 Tax=Nocardia shimofusensis TaxID=228596 RepID=UPI00082AFAE0|nr:endolytic transglycosylase MltG [Nocardia shimofusensis]